MNLMASLPEMAYDDVNDEDDDGMAANGGDGERNDGTVMVQVG